MLNHSKRGASAIAGADTLVYRLHAFDYLNLLRALSLWTRFPAAQTWHKIDFGCEIRASELS